MMNATKICFAATAIALCVPALAADWEALRRTPATIEIINMSPAPLVAGTDQKGWAKVPAQLTANGASIFMPTGGTTGVADIKVTGDGYLLVACNYDYQGNKGGKWDDEDWDERKFKTKGWHMMSKNELGGDLVKGDGRQQTVFSKQVRKGETFRLRCNKYDPPYPILLGKK